MRLTSLSCLRPPLTPASGWHSSSAGWGGCCWGSRICFHFILSISFFCIFVTYTFNSSQWYVVGGAVAHSVLTLVGFQCTYVSSIQYSWNCAEHVFEKLDTCLVRPWTTVSSWRISFIFVYNSRMIYRLPRLYYREFDMKLDSISRPARSIYYDCRADHLPFTVHPIYIIVSSTWSWEALVVLHVLHIIIAAHIRSTSVLNISAVSRSSSSSSIPRSTSYLRPMFLGLLVPVIAGIWYDLILHRSRSTSSLAARVVLV